MTTPAQSRAATVALFTADGVFVNGPGFCFEQATPKAAELLCDLLNASAARQDCLKIAVETSLGNVESLCASNPNAFELWRDMLRAALQQAAQG